MNCKCIVHFVVTSEKVSKECGISAIVKKETYTFDMNVRLEKR